MPTAVVAVVSSTAVGEAFGATASAS